MTNAIWLIILFVLGFWLWRGWLEYRQRQAEGKLSEWENKLVSAIDQAVSPWQSRWQAAEQAWKAPGIPPASESTSPTPQVTSAVNLPLAPVVVQTTEPLRSASTATPPEMARAQFEVELPPGTTLQLIVEAQPDGQVRVRQTPLSSGWSVASPATRSLPPPAWLKPLQTGWTALKSQTLALEKTLFGLSLLVYLFTRLWGLDKFPIYFFTDEAIHTNLAADFWAKGLRNPEGDFLPAYFFLGSYFNLNGISVYAQLLPYLVLGKSVFVTRAVSVFITLIAAWAVGAILRDFFKARYWWCAVLLLSITPTWYLHSRTAFEYAELTAFYAGFIYFYLRYRYGSPRALYVAVVFGAATFYTHGLGQVTIGATALVLLIVDWRYHWEQREVVARGAALAVLFSLPYWRFSLEHPNLFQEQLRQRESYWLKPVPVSTKVITFLTEYLSGLNPLYWYVPHTNDLIRHIMKGWGHLWLPTLPLALIGLGQVTRQWRSPAHRTVLIALLITPLGGALAAVSVLRLLWIVVPVAVLTGLGVSVVLEWVEKRGWRYQPLALGLAASLALVNVYLLWDTQTNGPLWFTNYSLYGMQYGAQQLMGEAIPAVLARDPQTQIVVSPSWANGTDNFADFFLTPDQRRRLRFGNIDHYSFEKRDDLALNTLLVMLPDEYNSARNNPKFKPPTVEEVINYPDGTPGFYFARLTYVDNADAIFAEEREARRRPVAGEVVIDGQTVQALYSPLGGGQLKDIFDGDRFTLIRGLEANPLVLEFTFPEPRSVTGLNADYATVEDFTVKIALYPPGENIEPMVYEQNYQKLPADPHVEMTFDRGPQLVAKVRFEYKNNLSGDTAQIHVRELAFRK